MFRQSVSFGVAAFLLSSGGQGWAQGADFEAEASGPAYQFDNFWSQVLPILEVQATLVERVQAVWANPDPAPREALRRELGDRLADLERFLRNQYREPDRLCLPGLSPPVTGLTREQQRVYCGLYQTERRWRALAASLSQAPSPSPFPLAPSSPRLSPQDLLNPPPPAIAPQIPLPASPPARPRVISQPAKRAFETERESGDAEGIPTQPLALLAAIRQELAALRTLLPTATAPLAPEADPEPVDPAPDYAAFLARGATGILRLRPVTQSADLATLPSRQPGYAPLLALVLADQELAIAPNPLRYGFLADLGPQGLERRSLRPDRRRYAFFWDYQPPPRLAAIQAHQRAFFFDKLGVGTRFPAAPPFPGRLPLTVNHTYLLRLVQYQLPTVVLNREPIPRERRRYASAMLDWFSSDLLLALQPVAQHPDGSYTILWQVLHQFPEPPITDLDHYVRFE